MNVRSSGKSQLKLNKQIKFYTDSNLAMEIIYFCKNFLKHSNYCFTSFYVVIALNERYFFLPKSANFNSFFFQEQLAVQSQILGSVAPDPSQSPTGPSCNTVIPFPAHSSTHGQCPIIQMCKDQVPDLRKVDSNNTKCHVVRSFLPCLCGVLWFALWCEYLIWKGLSFLFFSMCEE